MDVLELTREDARRAAVRAQLLTRERPTDLMETVRALSFLQLDPVSAVAPSADLVLWSRPGSAYDRRRMAELFEFEYVVEMYKPAAKRRWGYYALPILYGDRLVGKLDAKAVRDEGVLHVHAVHEDAAFTPRIREAVEAEIDDLARWLGLEVQRAG